MVWWRGERGKRLERCRTGSNRVELDRVRINSEHRTVEPFESAQSRPHKANRMDTGTYLDLVVAIRLMSGEAASSLLHDLWPDGRRNHFELSVQIVRSK